jgi:hypothetical protein
LAEGTSSWLHNYAVSPSYFAVSRRLLKERKRLATARTRATANVGQIRDSMNGESWRFLELMAVGNSVGASLQRGRVFVSPERTSLAAKKAFRSAFKRELRATAKAYAKPVTESDHLKRLDAICRRLSAAHGNCLRERRLRLGTVQKALNFYLKYLWCLGRVQRPPHCPFDSQIIGELGITPRIKFTSLDSRQEYRKLASAARTRARQERDRSIAHWELRVFNALMETEP